MAATGYRHFHWRNFSEREKVGIFGSLICLCLLATFFSFIQNQREKKLCQKLTRHFFLGENKGHYFRQCLTKSFLSVLFCVVIVIPKEVWDEIASGIVTRNISWLKKDKSYRHSKTLFLYTFHQEEINWC